MVRVLARASPRGITSDKCAALVGLRNRHTLAHRLRRAGYPCYTDLLDWTRFLGLLMAWEDEQQSLVATALEGGVEPSVCHRTVRRVCGTTWSSARRLGMVHWLPIFERQFHVVDRVDASRKWLA